MVTPLRNSPVLKPVTMATINARVDSGSKLFMQILWRRSLGRTSMPDVLLRNRVSDCLHLMQSDKPSSNGPCYFSVRP